jgi:NAD(P)-dependent dehydrogenase (short-subunit alcohol dehydrogenase family)
VNYVWATWSKLSILLDNGLSFLMDFKGRNVLITGGGNGIGAATANKFSGYGANVIVTDWDKAAAESVAKEIVDSGGIALGLKLDVTKIEDWKAAAVSIHAAYGKVNVVLG